MFGINKKLYISLSIFSLIIAVALVIMGIVDMFNQRALLLLAAIAMALLSLCLLLKPSANLLKISNEFLKNIRVDFYKELEEKEECFDNINIFEKDGILFLE